MGDLLGEARAVDLTFPQDRIFQVFDEQVSNP